ncbi:MAG: imidazole glycerol phosphate synthase subunit HisH [Candidatus Peribacteraceae bacterium]|jgi:glutamine amidotransferase|nr:imidazole glycerol phosphate synthase subunit HisH [Candidatus Peribacteraceae bacterium]
MAHICIVDYGIGNIFSAMKALRRFTQDVILSEDPKEIGDAAALVLPGQGAFEAGMEGLRVRGLLDEVKAAASKGKPILGICLGAQLLLEKGYEFGEWKGLGLLPGEVVHFPVLEQGAKTPHMGWNSIIPPAGHTWEGTVLKEVVPGADMYFIHSYFLKPNDPAHILAETTYGGLTFASVIGKGPIIGCQFHPEKSGEAGLRILKNFVALAR